MDAHGAVGALWTGYWSNWDKTAMLKSFGAGFIGGAIAGSGTGLLVGALLGATGGAISGGVGVIALDPLADRPTIMQFAIIGGVVGLFGGAAGGSFGVKHPGMQALFDGVVIGPILGSIPVLADKLIGGVLAIPKMREEQLRKALEPGVISPLLMLQMSSDLIAEMSKRINATQDRTRPDWTPDASDPAPGFGIMGAVIFGGTHSGENFKGILPSLGMT